MAASAKKIVAGGQEYDEVTDLEPYHKNRIDYFNKQGWGYNDSSFQLDKQRDVVKFTGSKYLYSG